ncbi:MAG: EutN/CcmL family microcompartment protein, partial [Deltaproteobacteria bacterium]|nr:EutN/CcmL family microcompartment protein [Deltaproteobacteria bacterium]
MFLGRVIGTVWSTVKWDGLEGLKFLIVRPYHYNDLLKVQAISGRFTLHDGVVAADVLGAGIGEDVIVAYGHSARVGIEPEIREGALPMKPIDAAVVAIVDRK